MQFPFRTFFKSLRWQPHQARKKVLLWTRVQHVAQEGYYGAPIPYIVQYTYYTYTDPHVCLHVAIVQQLQTSENHLSLNSVKLYMIFQVESKARHGRLDYKSPSNLQL